QELNSFPTRRSSDLGNVNMIQGDTLFLNSKYAEYDGNTKIALAKGDVVMRDSQMTLTTEQIHFDRSSQQAYYNTGGKIINTDNTDRKSTRLNSSHVK